MSQARVTDFFSTRKRCRQDEVTLNKEKRLKSVEPPQITTRSRAKNVVTEINQSKKIDETPPVENIIIQQEQQKMNDTTNKPVGVKQKQKLSAEELKQRMQNFSQKLQKHKEKYAKNNDDNIEKEKLIETQVENLTKIQDQINKICSKDNNEEAITPAYSKYASLATVDYEQKLVLPNKYQNLFELFKGSDTVVKFIHNRQEICTYLKLKTAIQNMTKKNFNHNNLGQIITVYPTAYILKQEKLYIDFKNDYHLTVEPNFEKDIVPNENGVKIMSPLLLLERLQKFKTRLFDLVKDVHQKFLKTIGVNMDSKDIKRWHPKFDLEEIEDILAAELPQKPNEVKCKGAEDLKNIAKEVYSTRVKSAIDVVLQQQEKEKEQLKQQKNIEKKDASTLTLNQPANTLKEKQKNNYNALLERVREKERHKDIENMVINSDKEKRLQLLEKYNDCVRFIKSFFQAEKKATIDLENVCKKMHESIKSHTANECEDIIKELCKDFNNWISIIKVRQQQYVKIDKTIELNDIVKKISTMIDAVKA